MSESNVAALEHAVHDANVWLKALAEKLHFEDRSQAYNALRAVLHALRDRLTPEMAVHMGAQLPTFVRGVYYEGWHMAGKPTHDRSAQEFADHVLKELPPRFARDPLTVSKGVFQLLWEKLDPGESAKVIDQLPVPLRALWPDIARRS